MQSLSRELQIQRSDLCRMCRPQVRLTLRSPVRRTAQLHASGFAGAAQQTDLRQYMELLQHNDNM